MFRTSHLLVAAGLASGMFAAPIWGADVTWTNGAGDSDWFNTGNWSSGNLPGSGDRVLVYQGTSELSPLVIDNVNAPAVATNGESLIGRSGQGSGYVAVYTDLQLANARLGDGSFTGQIVQHSGTVSVTGTLLLAWNTQSTGIYDMKGGTLNVANLVVSREGTGQFVQSEGQVNITSRLTIASEPNNVMGSYTISGNPLTSKLVVNEVRIGEDANATFNQLGGAVESAGAFVLAWNPGATANYNISGGTLAAKGLQIRAGTGSINQTDGDITLSDHLRLGSENNATGSYTISGGSLSIPSTGHHLYAGSKAGVNSTIHIRGDATVTIGGDIHLHENETAGDVRFIVEGGLATIQVGNRYLQRYDSVLEARLDATGLSTIVSLGNADFREDSILDVKALPGAQPGTYTLMTWQGSLVNSSLRFADTVNTDLWSFNLDPVSKTLTITYVPEPATVSMLGLGSLLVLRRRRGPVC